MSDNKPGCKRDCWCGESLLQPFSPDYLVCKNCGTLVSQVGLTTDALQVHDDASDFYGKEYWLAHMSDDLGYPKIDERARLDLPERCAYWLRHLLAYKLPPARVLELGCAHGGFVSMLKQTGYDAIGLEMSPWVAELARKTFDAPVLLGPVENQDLAPGSLDAIVASDVLEHLPDPLATIRHCLSLLKDDGVLIIQMPNFLEESTYPGMVAAQDRFLAHLVKSDEHLYLYSKRAARLLCQRLGLPHVNFHDPIFDYDMYFVASRTPQAARTFDDIAQSLQRTPAGRHMLALLDKARESSQFFELWQTAEKDRAERLAMVQDLGGRLHDAHRRLTESDADRQARLQSILKLERMLMDSEADRSARLQAIAKLEQQMATIDADRTARLRTIAELSRTLLAADEDRTARLRVILEQEKLLQHQQETIADQQRALEFLRGAGVGGFPPLWKRVSKKLAKMVLPASWRLKLRARFRPGSVPPAVRQKLSA